MRILTRREMLRTSAGAALAAAQVPLRLPLGALDYLDRKQYIHNMEVHAHLPGVTASGGEPLTALWAKGPQRLLSGGGGFLDITDPKKVTMVFRGAYQGSANIVYNRQLKKWIALASAQAPLTDPNLQYPRGKYHPEYAERSISSKAFRGIRTYDVTDPAKVSLLAEFGTGQTGSGTHMNFYDGGKYA